MIPRILFSLAATLLFALGVTTVSPQPAAAGCGCDHPPPAWAPIMPAFGAAGRVIRIHPHDASFVAGRRYRVYLETPTSSSSWSVRAEVADYLQTTVPSDAKMGAAKIRVSGRGYDHTYGSNAFTVLPQARQMPTSDSVVMLHDYPAAVAADGTLLIPMDLSVVQDATQFAFVLADLPLSFGTEDVVFYNRDGVDLTLFTLAVDDPTERTWGSYFGWDVEEDTGLVGTVYETKVQGSLEPGLQSDLLTYWRHEFHTYTAAHVVGGTHEVSEGFHPDGTFHIDHDMLVVAISGVLPDGRAPAPGWLLVDLIVTAVVAENPVEPEVMQARASGSDLYVEENAALDEVAASFKTNWTGDASITLESDGTVEEMATTLEADATTLEAETKSTKIRGKGNK